MASSAAPSHQAVKRSCPTPAHDAASAAFARSHESSWLRSLRLVGVVAEVCASVHRQVVRAANACAWAHPTRARRRRRAGSCNALQLPRHDDVRNTSAKGCSGASDNDRGPQRSRHLRRARELLPKPCSAGACARQEERGRDTQRVPPAAATSWTRGPREAYRAVVGLSYDAPCDAPASWPAARALQLRPEPC